MKLVGHLLRCRAPFASPPPPAPDLAVAVEQARREYHAAQAYFQTVSEGELIDQAIHLVSAAEKRLLYLLRKAGEEGVTGPVAGCRKAVR